MKKLALRLAVFLAISACMLFQACCQPTPQMQASAPRLAAHEEELNRATHYEVGAWFFSLWNSSAQSLQVRQSRKVYGRSDAWAGVRDYAFNRGRFTFSDPETGQKVDFSNRQPLIGFYDLNDQATVDNEIAMASSIGLSFFALYWYIDPYTGDEISASSPTMLFFNSTIVDGMRFLLAIIVASEEGRTKPVSFDIWRDKIVPRIYMYMQKRSYFSIDGRPVIYDFNIQFKDVADYKNAYAYLREYINSHIGVYPVIIRVLSNNTKIGDVAFFDSRIHPDGFSCFSFGIEGNAEPYNAYTDRWLQRVNEQFQWSLAANRDSIFIPCASIGIDARPWRDISFDRPLTYGTNSTNFRKHLEQMRDFIDANHSATRSTIIIYAWNEWGEAAESIEPSKRYGYTYADTVQHVFDLKGRVRRRDELVPAP